jgi:magnesium transporter
MPVKKVHPGNKVKAIEEVRRLKLATSPGPDKKALGIKDISRVLSEIEESKKSQKIIYFSQLQGKGVYDAKKKRIGKLKDLAISGGITFPEVSHVLVQRRSGMILIPWQNISEFKDFIVLDKPLEEVSHRLIGEDDVFIGHNILDKQVVDVNGLKVIRVNDLALTFIKGKLAVVSIDIGSRSILRRLGMHYMADHVPWFKDHPLPWGNVEPLTRSLEKIHLKVPCARVSDLHPADVAELFDELSNRERKILLKSMKSEKAAKVLVECEADIRAAILKSLKSKRLASILEKMPANDAANLLAGVDNVKQGLIFKNMEKEAAFKIQNMLSYKHNSVARFMSNTFVTARKYLTAEEAINLIRSFPKKPDNFHYVYIVDESDVLCGVVSLKNLIISPPKSVLAGFMVQKVVTVDINDPIEYVMDIVAKYDLLSIPVVDVSGKLRGVVNIYEIMDLIIERSKAHQPIELSEGLKKRIQEDKRVKDYYKLIIKDIGQLVKDLEPARIFYPLGKKPVEKGRDESNDDGRKKL